MIELCGKRIVMTGATGFIGANVAHMLLEAGAEVYCLVRPRSGRKGILPSHPKLHVVWGEMGEAVSAVSQIGQADAFFHFAWRGVNRQEIDSRQVQQRNVSDSFSCIRAARLLGCQIFMDAGSRVEYGITPDGVMEESMECRPVNEYGKAKLDFYREAACLFRQWNITYYHLRFFSVYGRGDHPWSIVSTLVRELPEGRTVSLSACRHQWNFMEIEDASRAVLELYRFSDGHRGQCRVVNVASEDTRTLRDFVEEIHKLCENRGKLDYGSFVQAREGALSIRPRIETLKSLTEGTWREQVTFEAGIRRMLEEKER